MIFHESPPGTFTEVRTDLFTDSANIAFSNFAVWSDAELAVHNCYRLELPTPPAGEIISDYSAGRDANGVVQLIPVYQTLPAPDYKQIKKDQIDAMYVTKLSAGYVVPANLSATLAGDILQLRSAEDRANWEDALSICKEQVAAGNGATVGFTIRPESNVNKVISFSEGQAVLMAMRSWGLSALQNAWTLKDQVKAANADQASMDAIDITQGWPS